MKHHRAVVMATSDDRSYSWHQLGMTFGQKLEIHTGGRLSVQPLFIWCSQVYWTLECIRPIYPVGVEVWMRDDDEFKTTEFVDLRCPWISDSPETILVCLTLSTAAWSR